MGRLNWLKWNGKEKPAENKIDKTTAQSTNLEKNVFNTRSKILFKSICSTILQYFDEFIITQ